MCVAAWSLIPTLASDTGRLDPPSFLFWSNVVSTAVLAACAWRVARRTPAAARGTRENLAAIAGLGALGTYLYYALLYRAYAPCAVEAACPDKAPLVIVLQYTWPALTVLLSRIVLAERLRAGTAASLALGVAAVASSAFARPHAPVAWTTVATVLAAAGSFALYSVLVRRIELEPMSGTALMFLAGSLLALVEIAATGTLSVPRTAADLWPVLVNGVVVNGVSYVWWHRALRAAPIGRVAPWVCLTPVVAALVYDAGHEGTLATGHWLGLFLVLLSVRCAIVSDAANASRLSPRRLRRPRPAGHLPAPPPASTPRARWQPLRRWDSAGRGAWPSRRIRTNAAAGR
jgi:drug/metabolite transporter (DMT)-like permease